MASLFDIDYDDFVDKLTPWLLRDAEFVTSNGDVAYGDTLDQEITFILTANKGNFYQSPRIGAAIGKKLNGSANKQAIRNDIVENLKEDNIKITDLQVIGQDDVARLGIRDSEILSRLKQDKYIISIKATR